MRLSLGRHILTVSLWGGEPSLGILGSPVVQESEITNCHLLLVLQVLGSKMTLKST